MSEHIPDLPYWALGLDFPTRISSFSSKRFIKDNTDAPDTHEVTFEFPELTLTWSMSQVNSFGFNLQDVSRYTKRGAKIDGVQRRLSYFLRGVEGAIYGDYRTHQVARRPPHWPWPIRRRSRSHRHPATNGNGSIAFARASSRARMWNMPTN
jgi:hypothetical protein